MSITEVLKIVFEVHNVCLFKCDKCEVYFKSKKGYEGHVANRHTPRLVGVDGKLKSKKEMEGLNKVSGFVANPDSRLFSVIVQFRY